MKQIVLCLSSFMLFLLLFSCSGSEGKAGASNVMDSVKKFYKIELNNVISEIKTELGADSIVHKFEDDKADNAGRAYKVDIFGKKFCNIDSVSAYMAIEKARDKLRKVVLGVHDVVMMKLSIHATDKKTFAVLYMNYFNDNFTFQTR